MKSHPQNTEEQRIQSAYQKRSYRVPPDRYSLENPSNLFQLRERDQHLFRGIQRHSCTPLRDEKILDIGCGRGWQLAKLIRWGASAENLFGIDLLSDQVERAKHNLPPQVILEVGSAAYLDHPDETFDIVLQFTVFSSILQDKMREDVAREMLRVLKPTGYVIWYDFFVSNPWNADVRGVGKGELKTLFPGCHFELERLTAVPPLARALGKISPRACRYLSALKLFSTHYLGFFTKLPV